MSYASVLQAPTPAILTHPYFRDFVEEISPVIIRDREQGPATDWPDDGWKGFRVRLASGDIWTYLMDNWQSCCERFDMEIDSNSSLNLDSAIGQEFYSMKFNEHHDPTHISDRERRGEDVYCATVTLKMGGGEIHFVAWNHHNGYYSHGVKLGLNETWDYSII